MKLLDERGIGTVWSICKEKFALVGHTHNYAGSGSPGGSANSAIGVVDYNQTGKTIQIGYYGTGITGDQIKYIAGYTDGSGNVNAKIKDVSKDALKSWLGLGSLAYSSSSIPTKLSQLNNDKGFVTGSVSGNTVTINGASTTWTNTWRGIQDNLTSSSTSDSLSANQGRVLKELIDSKADSDDLSSYAQKSDAIKNISIEKMPGLNTQLFIQTIRANSVIDTFQICRVDDETDGLMSVEDKAKLDGIESGANNYTLPTASEDNFGGVRVSTSYEQYKNSPWPIYVNRDNKIYTDIRGLGNDGQNSVSYIELTEGNNTTKYSNKRITLFYGEPHEYTIDLPTGSGTLARISDIPTKTSQLTNDSTFLTSADKYILPVASQNTLGGIKSHINYPVAGWPVCVNNNGFADTKIVGLAQNKNDASIKSITVKNGIVQSGYQTTYETDGIQINDNNKIIELDFPIKTGTFALLSDIPNVSNLCKFNFVNSISDCVNGRINFLFKNSNDYVDLSFLNNLEEGTILLIYSPHVGFQITDKSTVWYYNGTAIAANDTAYINHAILVLAFFYNTYVYVSTFSYN